MDQLTRYGFMVFVAGAAYLFDAFHRAMNVGFMEEANYTCLWRTEEMANKEIEEYRSDIKFFHKFYFVVAVVLEVIIWMA